VRLHKLYGEVTGANAVKFKGGTEVIVATFTGVTTDVGSREIYLIGECYWKQSAGTTKTIIRIRRGTEVTGTLVQKCEYEAVVSKLNEYTIQAKDTVGETANGSYVLTMEETKAGEEPESLESKLRVEY